MPDNLVLLAQQVVPDLKEPPVPRALQDNLVHLARQVSQDPRDLPVF